MPNPPDISPKERGHTVYVEARPAKQRPGASSVDVAVHRNTMRGTGDRDLTLEAQRWAPIGRHARSDAPPSDNADASTAPRGSSTLAS